MSWEILPCDQFSHHHEAWQALNESRGGSQLLDARFIDAALVHFASGDERLCIFRDGGTVRAMGIFRQTGRMSWQTFQPANAPLGAWLSARQEPLEAFLDPLMASLPGFALLLGITQQDPDILAPPIGPRFDVLDYIQTSRITITGDFEAYWMSRGKNLRHNIKRQRNRLDRDGFAPRLEIVTAPEAMAEAVADYADLETRGWKGEADTAVMADDAQARFYVQVLKDYATRNEAAVWRYFFGDRLAASDICIHRNGVLIILKTAYDESFKGYSPAQLMRHEAFQRLFDEDGFRTIEFYGPVKDWHTKWTQEFRHMYHANYYRFAGVRALHQKNRKRAAAEVE